MAFNEHLAQVIRDTIEGVPGVVEKKMFGGIAFLINGNLSVGIHKENLIIRVGPDKHDKALSKPHTKVFDITGRPMKGWIMVLPEGHSDPDVLEKWIKEGIIFASSLPRK